MVAGVTIGPVQRFALMIVRVLIAVVLGVMLTLLSTFVGEREAAVTYPDIMGCETGCSVVATGWPLVFVRDYTGVSVVNTADILEVWFAADRFDWVPFCADVAFWTLACFVAERWLRSRFRRGG